MKVLPLMLFFLGIGLDSCVIPLRNNLYLLQTTDFFYPLIDDPYMMGKLQSYIYVLLEWRLMFLGKITCANVLSDLYSSGVIEVDCLSVIFSVCLQMNEDEQNAIIPMLIKGFQVTYNNWWCINKVKLLKFYFSWL